jgi:hypothetical protein
MSRIFRILHPVHREYPCSLNFNQPTPPRGGHRASSLWSARRRRPGSGVSRGRSRRSRALRDQYPARESEWRGCQDNDAAPPLLRWKYPECGWAAKSCAPPKPPANVRPHALRWVNYRISKPRGWHSGQTRADRCKKQSRQSAQPRTQHCSKNESRRIHNTNQPRGKPSRTQSAKGAIHISLGQRPRKRG